jgi:hypothetical protein
MDRSVKLARRPPAERLALLLNQIGWDNRGFATRIGCGETLVRRWRAGETQVPDAILDWLTALVAFMAAYPAPDWRVRQRQERKR